LQFHVDEANATCWNKFSGRAESRLLPGLPDNNGSRTDGGNVALPRECVECFGSRELKRDWFLPVEDAGSGVLPKLCEIFSGRPESR